MFASLKSDVKGPDCIEVFLNKYSMRIKNQSSEATYLGAGAPIVDLRGQSSDSTIGAPRRGTSELRGHYRTSEGGPIGAPIVPLGAPRGRGRNSEVPLLGAPTSDLR